MKKAIKIFILLAFVICMPIVYATPSFDCKKSKTDIEKAICKDETLNDYDRVLSIIYKKALQISSNPEKIRIEQIQWMKNRPNFEKGIEKILLNFNNRELEHIESGRAVFEKDRPIKGDLLYEQKLISSLRYDYQSRIKEFLESDHDKLLFSFLSEFIKNPEKSDKMVVCLAIVTFLERTQEDFYNLLSDIIKNFRFVKLTSNKILVLLNTSNGAYRETYDFYTIYENNDKVSLRPYILSYDYGSNCNNGRHSWTGNFGFTDFCNKVITCSDRLSCYESGASMIWRLKENCGELVEKNDASERK